ncbi:DUF2218 domain-containing protein [Hyphomicrobium sp. D-2]|uniref:DUF2218 domain-containing protein n=1 Tax=Hyphomicrobium sp. D-2 TaxID=3041621 RepID=UPI0024578093|nr:DUF2218 domain-containing protein [Hyphomicrobium sp. D-2]MDH4982145.1 DUF2218 domain-containing protein [Hyphomicrobium sp. D-2]
MFVAKAEVKTPKASVYLVQLCKHFAHKVHATYDDSHGTVRFKPGVCIMRADRDVLSLHCEADSEHALATVKATVGDHLVRFAWREELPSVEWVTCASADTRTIPVA